MQWEAKSEVEVKGRKLEERRRRQVASGPMGSQDMGERAKQHRGPSPGPGGAKQLGETKEETSRL